METSVSRRRFLQAVGVTIITASRGKVRFRLETSVLWGSDAPNASALASISRNESPATVLSFRSIATSSAGELASQGRGTKTHHLSTNPADFPLTATCRAMRGRFRSDQVVKSSRTGDGTTVVNGTDCLWR
jgi:hypothetical protein